MRVIAGTARGIKLKAPTGFSIRPTADRVKEALFSILGHRAIDSLFLDLYAGSGAIGIEALSRGARFCIFVDRQKNNLSLVKENLMKTKLEKNIRLIMADTDKAIPRLAEENVKADLIFLDPPYSHTDISTVVCCIIRHRIIDHNGLIIVEHASSNQQWAEDFTETRQKRYGDTCLTFITPNLEHESDKDS